MTWKAPEIGDIVWCRFPELPSTEPAFKCRPALVISVGSRPDGVRMAVVAYGTSKHVDQRYPGQFVVRPQDGDAFDLTGLAHATRFDLKKRVTLPWNDMWFDVAPNEPFGHHPKMGLISLSLERRLRSAVMEIRG